MKSARLFLPLLFAIALLFTQQVGAAHALGHALEQAQQDKKAPHSFAVCEQCAAYAQLGSTLNTPTHHLTPIATADEFVSHREFAFRSPHVFAAAARGPPALPRYA
jgi:hypothetical protein